MLRFVVVLLFLAAGAPMARADPVQFRVCNGASQKIWTAVGLYDDQSGSWSAQGWLALDPGACSDPVTSALATVYLYGNTQNGVRVWSGGQPLCVNNDDGFNIPHADSDACNGRGLGRLGFFQWNIDGQQATYTFTDQDAALAKVTRTLCNQTTERVIAAVAGYQSAEQGWTTTGWYALDPGKCWSNTLPVAGNGQVYVYARNNADLAWRGQTAFCLDDVNAFNLPNADTRACNGQNEARQLFRAYTADQNGQVHVNFQAATATRVGVRLKLCNKTPDPALVSFGTGQADGLLAEGAMTLEPGKCQDYARAAKLDRVYLSAQTPNATHTWYGSTALCTHALQGFTIAKADVATCDGPGQMRKGFFPVTLNNGQGSYDLTFANSAANTQGLTLCNDYGSDVFATVAVADPLAANGLVAHGWVRLETGTCTDIASVKAPTAYVFANDDRGQKTWSGNDQQLCVDQQDGFLFANAATRACTGGNLAKVGFLKWTLTPGANVYRFQ